MLGSVLTVLAPYLYLELFAEGPVSGASAPARIGRFGLYAFLVGMAPFFAIPLLVGGRPQ